MQTIRQYIKNYKQLAFSNSHHTPSSSQKSRINSNILQANTKQYQSIQHQSNYDLQSNLYPRKISLPPIAQRLKKSPSIDLKGSCVIDRYLHSKSIVAPRAHRRSKTEQQKLAYKLSHRSQIPLNAQQMRMRPMVKYQYHLQNIRLAEKLLVIKPSRDVNRTDQKKFFKQQKHYRDQISISKGHVSIKSSRKSKISIRKHQL